MKTLKSSCSPDRLMTPLQGGCAAPSTVRSSPFVSLDVNYNRLNQHSVSTASREMTKRTKELIARMREGKLVFKGRKTKKVVPIDLSVFAGLEDF